MDDKKVEYTKWLLEKFNIKITEKNQKYFYGVIAVNLCNNNYCSNVLAFKGDPLISFMVCDKSMDNEKLTNDRKLTNFTIKKEYLISDNFFVEIFDYYNFSNFTDHNGSNQVGKEVKSACIEALIYACYKSFDIEKAWDVWSKILQDIRIDK